MAYPTSGPQWQPPGGGWPPPPPGYGWPPRPPVDPAAADGPLLWFKVYAGAMALLYLVMAGAGLLFLVADLGGTPDDVTGQRVTGAIYCGLGLILLTVFAIGVLMPKRPWAWIYGIVLIGLGMTSCCTLPATIPLLIFWLKPEMKARFGRT